MLVFWRDFESWSERSEKRLLRLADAVVSWTNNLCFLNPKTWVCTEECIQLLWVRVRMHSECLCNMGDVAALPDLDVLRVQMWIRTSFYSLTCRWVSLTLEVGCDPSLLLWTILKQLQRLPTVRLSQVTSLWIVGKYINQLHYLYTTCMDAHLARSGRTKGDDNTPISSKIRYVCAYVCMYFDRYIVWKVPFFIITYSYSEI